MVEGVGFVAAVELGGVDEDCVHGQGVGGRVAKMRCGVEEIIWTA